MNRSGSREKTLERANKGFSLVEVLVCIAVLAIISVPLFSGLRLSAKLNHDAHYVQMTTAYAQEEMETIKSVEVEKYKEWVGTKGTVTPITEGEVFERAQDARNIFSAKHPEIVDTTELDILFSPFVCEQKNIKIGNRTYTLRAVFEPALYSKENSGTDAYASDINVAGFGVMPEADAARFPVISDELNQYEASVKEEDETASAIIFNIRNRLEAAGISASLQEIHNGLVKEIIINIGKVNDGKIKVEGYVNYTYSSMELKNKVYSATYDYKPETSEPENKDEIGQDAGGNIFIFARAFQDKELTSTHVVGEHCYNKLSIKVEEDSRPVSIYFIRGSLKNPLGGEWNYNFDEIEVNGENYMTNLSGTMKKDNWAFHTNVKRKDWDLSLLLDKDKEDEMILGRRNYDARCYHVTVQMFDEEGNKVADMQSSKVE